MLNSLRRPPLYITALALILIMSGLRWFAGGTDFSYFFTAGTDFVDPQSTPHPIVTMEGQGYDGQFFYRLAMDPFNWDKTANGVTIDYPSYRVQRIGYPFLAWLFSFGGIPVMVPFALWLVNLLSFAGIIYYFKRIAEKFRADSWFHFVPLLVCGIYMSVAKSLSEVTELFFFLAAFHAILDKRMVLFACFGSAAVLTRETAVIPMVALSVVFFFQYSDDGKVRSRLLAAVPLMMLICWKLFLAFVFRDEPAPPSLGNFTWPFKGIADGFMANMNFTSRFYALQSAFWLMYFIWQTWFSLLVFKASLSKRITLRQPYAYPLAVYFAWLIFSVFFSAAIYGDDWSFVRVLALMNIAGFAVMVAFRQTLNRYFVLFSIMMVALTVIRMILRP